MEAEEEERFKKMKMANSTKYCRNDGKVEDISGFGYSPVNFHPHITL